MWAGRARRAGRFGRSLGVWGVWERWWFEGGVGDGTFGDARGEKGLAARMEALAGLELMVSVRSSSFHIVYNVQSVPLEKTTLDQECRLYRP